MKCVRNKCSNPMEYVQQNSEINVMPKPRGIIVMKQAGMCLFP